MARPIKKGQHLSPATEFKPGQIPRTKLPVGSVRMRFRTGDTPRAWIKIAEPHHWIPRAQYVWMLHHGAIPRGHEIHHLNEKTLDDTIDNLLCLSSSEHGKAHTAHLIEARKKIDYSVRRSALCTACGIAYTCKRVNKTRPNFCPDCATSRENLAKRRYALAHSRAIPRALYKVKRFHEGELWLMHRLLDTHLYPVRTIAKMFATHHSTVLYHARHRGEATP
jgi:hypothetical protein